MNNEPEFATKLCETELGYVAIVVRDESVISTTLPESAAETALAHLKNPDEAHAHIPATPFAEWVAELIAHYCAGEPIDLVQVPVAYATDMPKFTRMAREACRSIPRGQARTYRWLAEQAGNPSASRAAGRAMATNPVPLLVPCHRVVGSDGRLTGFGGSRGLPLKEHLLAMEGFDPLTSAVPSTIPISPGQLPQSAQVLSPRPAPATTEAQ